MEDWKKLEAILFASGKYLTEEQLTKITEIPINKIKKALQKLKKEYEQKDTSLKIYHEINAWKINVKEEYTDIIREVVSDAEMPRAVMETLAIIAYKSPVLQSEIIDIRGTTAYDHVSMLETKGFIQREKHGRSYKIKLANKFHEYFDIESDRELAELFKNVKKPPLEKLGTLEVYEEKENDDTEFTEKIIERMKKLEKTNQDQENEDNFLNNFEEKFEKTKQNIDESEKDIQSFRKKLQDDEEDIFKNKQKEENEDEENSNEEETQEDTNELENDEEEQKEENEDEENSNEEETQEDTNELENDEEEQKEENEEINEDKETEEDEPDFIKKINKQIDEMTQNQNSKEKQKEENDDEQEENTN